MNNHIFHFITNDHVVAEEFCLVLLLCQRLKACVICVGDRKTVARPVWYASTPELPEVTKTALLSLIPNFVILCVDPRTYQLTPAPLLIFSRLNPVESQLNNVRLQLSVKLKTFRLSETISQHISAQPILPLLEIMWGLQKKTPAASELNGMMKPLFNYSNTFLMYFINDNPHPAYSDTYSPPTWVSTY